MGLGFLKQWLSWLVILMAVAAMSGCAAVGKARVTAKDPETGESVTQLEGSLTIYNDELHQYLRDSVDRVVGTMVSWVKTVQDALTPPSAP